jgi:hypothetical protein
MSVTYLNNDEISFALVQNERSLDLAQVRNYTERNVQTAVSSALRQTYASETDHTLYILVNDRFWLPDPLNVIKEAVELESGTVKEFDLSKRQFTVKTKDDFFQLHVVIHGEGKDPKKQGVTEEGKSAVVTAEQEVIELLDTSNSGEESGSGKESESDYEYFEEEGLTQFVSQVHGVPAPFELPLI